MRVEHWRTDPSSHASLCHLPHPNEMKKHPKIPLDTLRGHRSRSAHHPVFGVGNERSHHFSQNHAI